MTERSPRPRQRPRRSLPTWRLLDLGRCPPVRAVAFSESVARSVGRGDVPNTLLLAQSTRACISIGFHQSLDAELDQSFLLRHRLPVIRRVEGGGTVFLDRDQLFYQFVYADAEGSPGGPVDFARYLSVPIDALRSTGVRCAFRPPSDIVVGDRKLSGNAGGEWEGAHIITGDVLGRCNSGAMADLFRLPDPALRPLLAREVARWMTSWENETGRPASWHSLRTSIAKAFQSCRLGRLEKGKPTMDEETTFRSETLPRHSDPSWTNVPPLPRSAAQPVRRIRVAGPHGVVVFEEPERATLEVAVVNRRQVVDAYRIRPGENRGLRRIPPGALGRAELARRVREAGGFD